MKKTVVVILLLAVIYLTFISLGLPDSVTGVAFPAIQQDWGLALSMGGIISMMIIAGTIVSSFISGYLIKALGTVRITLLSTLLTALALLGFSLSPSWLWLLVCAAPLGFGGGSVDAALNHYVALNFRAHHMNWLHSFWGIGATLGPLIMAATLSRGVTWKSGYMHIAVLQFFIAALILFSFPLWRLHKEAQKHDGLMEDSGITRSLFKIPGLAPALASMFLYCGVETSAGLWGSSFLVHARGLPVESAASWMAFYYGGITAGRFLAGFFSLKFSNTQMIRFGVITAIAGACSLMLPLGTALAGVPFIVTGLGLAPVFPAIIHETPVRFGREESGRVIGIQMGTGYIGSAFLPPLAGLALQEISLALLPLLLASAGILLLLLQTAGRRELKL